MTTKRPTSRPPDSRADASGVASQANAALDAGRFRAAIFDLDGVLVETRRLHRRAWKRVFDELLDAWRRSGHAPFDPFDADADYDRLVDGKPRMDGVRAFLESRGVELAAGDADDRVDYLTIRGVGERKNELYHQELDSTGVHVFDDVLPCLERLKSADLKLAVVTSSRNRERVVRSAGLEDWFDAAADGETLAEQGLAGKPAGDLFVEATRRLSVAPKHAAAFEDAIAGVQAAADAGCGAVFGVDRSGSGETARRFATNGATHVIKSLVHVDLRTTHEESEASRA